MSDTRAAILGEIATEAGIERNSFLTDAADQLRRFLDDQRRADSRPRRDGAHR